MKMKCIISPFNCCYQNIGSEEYYLSRFEEDIFYLYINAPAIIVGRHQNTAAEINQAYVRQNKIEVCRRLSGGGAVYHDSGNLNYGFIVRNESRDINEVFRELTIPIIEALQHLGANATFSGRNDLVIDGKKISGIAQYHKGGKVLLHGTLLFHSDLSILSQSLNVDPRKFIDKSVKSVQSRVTNILPYLRESFSIEDFTAAIMKEVILYAPEAELYQLSDDEIDDIQKLAANKYATWDWVYGNSPDFTNCHELKYENGLLHIGVEVENGIIRNLSLRGDFFGTRDIDVLTDCFIGIPYEKSAVESALSRFQLTDFIYHLSNERFIDCLFSNAL